MEQLIGKISYLPPVLCLRLLFAKKMKQYAGREREVS